MNSRILIVWLALSTSTLAGVTTATIGLLAPVSQVELSGLTPIYALEGQTNRVFFRNCVRYEGVWTDLTNHVTCSKGTQDGTNWIYKPVLADVGTVPFTLTVSDKASGRQLATKTVSLTTRAAAYPASPVSRKFLLIGDSTSAGGIVSAELFRLCDGDSQITVTQAGSNTGNVNDSTGTSRTVSLEGFPGGWYRFIQTNLDWAWTDLSGNPRVGIPFVNPGSGTFDFDYYQTTYTISMQAGDWVVFNMGINTITSAATDAALATVVSGELTALQQMIANVRATVPGIRIGVGITIPPNESIAAFQTDYPTSTWIYRYLRNHQIWVETLIATMDSSVTLIPIHVNLDCASDFANALHPGNSGYYKIAASYRMLLKGTE